MPEIGCREGNLTMAINCITRLNGTSKGIQKAIVVLYEKWTAEIVQGVEAIVCYLMSNLDSNQLYAYTV